MPSLRDIKSRIKSIKNTQKITQAMRMVAAAKVKKAENMVKAARPYTHEVTLCFKRILAENPPLHETSLKVKKAIDNYPALLKERDIQTVGLLVITSDKGLAGAYNTNVVRKTLARIKDIKKRNINVKLFIIGAKGINAIKRAVEETDVEIVKTYTKLPSIPTAGAASVIAEDLAESFVEKNIDKIEVITTKFKSMLSFQVEIWQVLPTVIQLEEEKHAHSEMLFEPTPEDVLQKLVPLYISNSIFQAMLEASASELASRMSAMANATDNASDMINYLTIVYNKARQASITQEILEVVSGAEALKG
jgi:F-type H+-transporting ATPase subunit gamma